MLSLFSSIVERSFCGFHDADEKAYEMHRVDESFSITSAIMRNMGLQERLKATEFWDDGYTTVDPAWISLTLSRPNCKTENKLCFTHQIDNHIKAESRQKPRIAQSHFESQEFGRSIRKGINMPKQKNFAKIHGAAVYFAHVSRDIADIARTFSVSERTVRRWAEEEEAWKESLSTCGYKYEDPDDLTFKPKPTRSPDRDAQDLFKAAHDEYINARKAGVALHKLPTLTAKNVGGGLSRRRVYEWAKKHRWQDIKTPEERIKIHCAATYFAHVSREIDLVARTFSVSEDLIQQWMKDAEWEKSLDACGYTGVRNLVKTINRTDFSTETDASKKSVVQDFDQHDRAQSPSMKIRRKETKLSR